MIYYSLIIRVDVIFNNQMNALRRYNFNAHEIHSHEITAFFKNGISTVHIRGSENKPLPPNYYLAKPFYKPVRKSDYNIGHSQQYS